MRKTSIFIFFILFSSVIFAENSIYIYVISMGKHSGLIIPRQYADISYLANKNKYSKEKYIEYGFGDKKYYMSPKPPSVYLGARAVLWPTQSVIRVSKANLKYDKSIKDVTLYSIKINKEKLELLNKFIKDTFKLKNGKAYSVGYSTYGEGDFYDGIRDFYLFNTCNSWIAKALNYAGYNINTWFIITKGDLESSLKNN